MFLVKRIKEPIKNIPEGYNSWLNFWEMKSGKKATICNKIVCYGRDNIIGVPVRKYNNFDQQTYIVPLCENEDNDYERFYVYGPLIPTDEE